MTNSTTNAASNQQLEPCPFCGQPVTATVIKDADYSLVGCRDLNCPASSISCYPDEWNSRVSDGGVVATKVVENLKAIIIRCDDGDPRSDWLPIISRLAKEALVATASPAAPKEEALIDEVQHRMDQVVDAAVEWHQTGREGGEWFEAAEKLGAAIDSLLELRSAPTGRANECFCGTELEAGTCPNGHDPLRPTATPSPDAARETAARKYFCSCGGALTAEEYIEHYFEKGHDRGEPELVGRVERRSNKCQT